MPIPLLMGIGAGLGVANSIGRFIGGIKQTKEAKKINPVFNQYQTNPYAQQQLGLAQQMFNGRMAGASQMQNNLFSNQGNTLDAIGRTATDGSQALAAIAGAQGQTDQSISDLQTMEAQNKYSMLGNLNAAYGSMINEGDKGYESMFQKYQMDAQRKDALANAGAQNKYGAVSDVASMGMSLGGGLLGGLFGGRQTNRNVIGGLQRGGITNQGLLGAPIQRTRVGFR